MSPSSNWLTKLAHLRVDRSRGIAPHKPLLILVVLELIESQELLTNTLRLTPALAFRFTEYWSIVAHRRTQRPDIKLPLYHLKSDDLWQPQTSVGTLSSDPKTTTQVELSPDFFTQAQAAEFRAAARAMLIKTYFEPAEQLALATLVGLDVAQLDTLEQFVRESSPEPYQAGRDIRFRLDIVAAYHYTCALTGYRVTTISGASIIDAAHIHQFSDSRNNDPTNGLALSKNAHWLFDQGLWSLDDNYQVLIAQDAFDESARDGKALREYAGSRIMLPEDERIWPDKRHLEWHRKHKFELVA